MEIEIIMNKNENINKMTNTRKLYNILNYA